jgi:hypothetical protein
MRQRPHRSSVLPSSEQSVDAGNNRTKEDRLSQRWLVAEDPIDLMIARRVLSPSSCACCALFRGLPVAFVRRVRCSAFSEAGGSEEAPGPSYNSMRRIIV